MESNCQPLAKSDPMTAADLQEHAPRAPRSPDHTPVQSGAALIRCWLARRLAADELAWLDEQTTRIGKTRDQAALASAIALAPHRLVAGRLALDQTERVVAHDLVEGFDPDAWSIAETARVLLMLARYDGDDAAFAASLASLLRSGDGEQRIALYRGLPLYPIGEELLALAEEGAASPLRPVFEAVAHNNPFPAAHFGEQAWNQMVLRAVKLGSRLDPIQRLDERRNANLARLLMQHLRERRGAHRSIAPELLRCVGPFASEDYFGDVVKVFRAGGGDLRKAAALALAECPTPQALIVLETAPTVWRDIRTGRLTWEHIGCVPLRDTTP